MTFHTRLRLSPETAKAFDLLGERCGRDKRRMNALLNRGVLINDIKKQLIREGQTSRQVNAIRIDLLGDRAARSALAKLEIKEKENRIFEIEKRLKKPVDRGGYSSFVAHYKKRKIARLKASIQNLQKNPTRIIFGGRNLWGAQRTTSENVYKTHERWLSEWRNCRSSQFSFVGSKSGSGGNESCQYDPMLGTLRIRLPNEYGGWVVLSDVFFSYGKKEIETAVFMDTAISYRFIRKPKGWYVFASTRVKARELVTDLSNGVIGVDVGPGLLAAVEIDEIGNPVWRKTYSLALKKKTSGQSKIMIQEAALEIVGHAKKVGKPISIEILRNFSDKKSEIKEMGQKYARMFTGFSYKTMHQSIKSRAIKDGVGIIEVNAAYSSTIGIVKFSAMYGLSSDEAAALCLARRAMRFKESIPTRTALARPEDRSRHVWGHWNRFGKALRSIGRHAFVAATRGPGGRQRVYPAFPARAAPA